VLTGRKKELFKTAKGKYVAPAPIENRLNAHPMVELSLVSGVGQPAAYAVVVLAEHLRPAGRPDAVRARWRPSCGAAATDVNQPPGHYEQLRMLVVAREPWSDRSRHADADDEDQAQPHRGRGGRRWCCWAAQRPLRCKGAARCRTSISARWWNRTSSAS
jgi:acyl-CoA synthetase (AMP-forming)/AMP-acid ligase II